MEVLTTKTSSSSTYSFSSSSYYYYDYYYYFIIIIIILITNLGSQFLPNLFFCSRWHSIVTRARLFEKSKKTVQCASDGSISVMGNYLGRVPLRIYQRLLRAVYKGLLFMPRPCSSRPRTNIWRYYYFLCLNLHVFTSLFIPFPVSFLRKIIFV